MRSYHTLNSSGGSGGRGGICNHPIPLCNGVTNREAVGLQSQDSLYLPSCNITLHLSLRLFGKQNFTNKQEICNM